jgi:hypothetical protein
MHNVKYNLSFRCCSLFRDSFCHLLVSNELEGHFHCLQGFMEYYCPCHLFSCLKKGGPGERKVSMEQTPLYKTLFDW